MSSTRSVKGGAGPSSNVRMTLRLAAGPRFTTGANTCEEGMMQAYASAPAHPKTMMNPIAHQIIAYLCPLPSRACVVHGFPSCATGLAAMLILAQRVFVLFVDPLAGCNGKE